MLIAVIAGRLLLIALQWAAVTSCGGWLALSRAMERFADAHYRSRTALPILAMSSGMLAIAKACVRAARLLDPG